LKNFDFFSNEIDFSCVYVSVRQSETQSAREKLKAYGRTFGGKNEKAFMFDFGSGIRMYRTCFLQQVCREERSRGRTYLHWFAHQP
jgi:hypothetical protein